MQLAREVNMTFITALSYQKKIEKRKIHLCDLIKQSKTFDSKQTQTVTYNYTSLIHHNDYICTSTKLIIRSKLQKIDQYNVNRHLIIMVLITTNVFSSVWSLGMMLAFQKNTILVV